MSEADPTNKKVRKYVEGVKGMAIEASGQFCEDYDIATRLNLSTLPLLTFSLYYAAYYARKSPDVIEMSRVIRSPIATIIGRIPLGNRLINSLIEGRDSFDQASSELMEQAQGVEIISTVLAGIAPLAFESLNKLETEDRHLPSHLQGLQEGITAMTEGINPDDPTYLKRMANLLTAANLNPDWDKEEKKAAIENILQKAEPRN